MKEVKVEKAQNGYIVRLLDFSGVSVVFKDFAELADYLFSYFGEETKS